MTTLEKVKLLERCIAVDVIAVEPVVNLAISSLQIESTFFNLQ